MFQINKTPILILSSARTGSSVLGEYIKNNINIKSIQYFIEPHRDEIRYRLFEECFRYDPAFILKIHHHNFKKHYSKNIVDYMLAESYKIRIYRKDFIKQAVSRFIGHQRNLKFHYRSINELDVNDTIPFNTEILKESLLRTKALNDDLINSDVPFDITLCYEDLPSLDNNGYYKTPPPLNYNELINATRDIVSSLGIDPIINIPK